jgi:hypothetical protein
LKCQHHQHLINTQFLGLCLLRAGDALGHRDRVRACFCRVASRFPAREIEP